MKKSNRFLAILRSFAGLALGLIAYLLLFLCVFTIIGGANIWEYLLTAFSVILFVGAHFIMDPRFRYDFGLSLGKILFTVPYVLLFPFFGIKYFIEGIQITPSCPPTTTPTKPCKTTSSSNSSPKASVPRTATPSAPKVGGLSVLKRRMNSLALRYCSPYASDLFISGGITHVDPSIRNGRVHFDVRVEKKGRNAASDPASFKAASQDFDRYIVDQLNALLNEARNVLAELDYDDLEENWEFTYRIRG